MQKVKGFFILLKHTATSFVADNAFKLSASLSYYTIYALCPLLIIIISLAGYFFGQKAVEGKIYNQINGLVGSEAALQIQEIIGNLHRHHSSVAGAVIGAVILIIAATGVFTEMQDSINFIWSVKAKPKKSWIKFLINRLISFSLVIAMSFILLVSLIINALLTLLSDRLTKVFPNYTVYLFSIINTVVIIVVITGLFSVIFKVLPDAIISWKDALIGAFFTSLLFLLGKFLIGYYLGNANMDITYGAAASIIVILSWVYYTALILYFGAEFTKTFALRAGEGIRPKDTAVFIIKRESKEVPASHLET